MADSRPGVNIDAGINQHFGKLEVAEIRRMVQGRHAVALCFVNVRAIAEQLPHRLGIAA